MKKYLKILMFLSILSLIILFSCTTQQAGEHAGQQNGQKTEPALNKNPAITDIIGVWEGKLLIGKTSLKIVFRITKDLNGAVKASLDSPDQGAYGIPVSKASYTDEKIILTVTKIRGNYTGTLSKDKKYIEGIWKQNGVSLPLKLSRKTSPGTYTKTVELKESKPPYPYRVENVKFKNIKEGITLAGTLTYPKLEAKQAGYSKSGGKFPAVILISGSGSQNRNEEVFGHKPFLVLADYLTRNGIAVLRYDDRGFGESGGNAENATSLNYAEDAYSAFIFLNSKSFVDKAKTGLIGHSEGALIASYLASNHKDIAFIVLLAGPGVTGKQLILMQSDALLHAGGASEGYIRKVHRINEQIYDIALKEKNTATAKEKITKILKNLKLTKEQIKMQEKAVLSPWYRFFLAYNPRPALEKVKCPVLALGGSLDLQVPARTNLKSVKDALAKGGNKHYTVMELKGLNHLFQHAKTGLPQEYARLKETFSVDALKIIADWIKNLN